MLSLGNFLFCILTKKSASLSQYKDVLTREHKVTTVYIYYLIDFHYIRLQLTTSDSDKLFPLYKEFMKTIQYNYFSGKP